MFATALACTTAIVAAAVGAPQAAANPVSAFYYAPAQFDTAVGSIIKTEPMQVIAAPPIGPWPVPAQKVLYTSRLQDDSPVAVSGVYVEATTPWQGPGPRPTVIVAPGTMGQGDQCAASVALSLGLALQPEKLSLSASQESLSVDTWHALGARVFVTDYVGLGTPGIHTYTNRREQAHAVLDGARAAQKLGKYGPETPLLFWGYSQGGGATAAAAELAPEYAPELNVKGVWAGGPTADLRAVIDRIDGALIGAAIGYAINGFVARYPELQRALDETVSPQGRAVLNKASEGCIGDIVLQQPFVKTTTLTKDGRSLAAHLKEIPESAKVFADQRIGNLRPKAPVLITSGRNDDTVPYGQARQLANDWCDKNATVTFRTNELPPILPGTTIPGHFGPELIDGYAGPVIPYLMDRLADKPISGCSID
ncbi:lipase family protein [Aldersonia kunmingensis]|uniref:lipase family protein n=1 Tax=Aldersonia kunmingensis TaxID=408066 RepID=UPI000830F0D1